MAKLQVTTPPAEEPVSLADAKAWMRIDHDEDNSAVTQCIQAARAWCEQAADRALVTRGLRLFLDAFPEAGCPIVVPMPRLISVTNLKYRDTAGVQQNIDPVTLQIDLVKEPGEIWPAIGTTWPAVQEGRVNPIEVEYTAGYGVAAAVDQRAKQAVLLLAAHWFENREALLTGTISKEIELGVRNLLAQLWHGRLA